MKKTALLLALLAHPVSGATLELEHAALARLLAVHAMTDGGRLYLDGSADTPCRHAFVQEPRVDAEAGRLRITFLFSGRQAAQVAGRCVGPGGTFDVRLSGVPRWADGWIVLDQPSLEAPGPGQAFFAAVAPLLESGLESRMRFPLKNLLGEAALALSASWGVQMSFEELDVPSIEVDDRALRLRFETRALVR